MTKEEIHAALWQCVRLKSGGPRMLVTAFAEAERCWCIWFDSAGVRHWEQFPHRALVPADNLLPPPPTGDPGAGRF